MANKKYAYEYPHPAVTVDCVIFGYDIKEGLSVLLVQRGVEPFKGQLAFPGGFLKVDEDKNAEEAARRELREETGLNPVWIEEFGCFSEKDRDPRERVITIAYLALVKKNDAVKGGDDAASAEWRSVDSLVNRKDGEKTLAFDHDEILNAAMSKLKEKIHFEPIGFDLLPQVFTMPQLYRLYESIGIERDRRNFSNKMLKLGILDKKPGRKKNAGPRIPVKYSFNRDKYEELKKKKRMIIEF